MSQSLDTSILLSRLQAFILKLRQFAFVLFVLLLAAVYGFVLLRVQTLSNIQPSDSEVNTQVQASATPHVNPTTVQQMQTLQDNSVSVRTLFNQARSNPFQE